MNGPKHFCSGPFLYIDAGSLVGSEGIKVLLRLVYKWIQPKILIGTSCWIIQIFFDIFPRFARLPGD
jgi:hypothetical protein